MDGWVTIGTKLDTKQLDKDIKSAEKELQKYEKEAEKFATQKMDIEAKVTINENEYKKKIDKLNQKYEAEIKTNTVFGQTKNIEKIDTKYDQLRYQLDIAYGKSLEANNYKLNKINKKIQENVYQQGLLNNKIEKMNDELNQAKSYDNIKNSIVSINKGIENVIKKTAKWAVAIFSVQSIYSGIRGIISTLTKYDETLAANLEYLKFAIANAFSGMVNWLVKAMSNLLTIIGRIIYLITGINIFKNSGIDDFEKALNNSSKSAKEIKKSFASFDEMNVLKDESQASNVSGGTTASFVDLPDLSQSILETTELEKVVQKSTNSWVDMGKEMKNTLDDPQAFDKAYGYWGTFVYGVTDLFYGIYEVVNGLIETIGGLADIIVGVFTLDSDKILEGWEWVKNGISDLLNGLWDILVGLVVLILGLIKGLLNELWSGIKGFFSLIWEGLGNLWSGIKDGAKSSFDFVKNIFSKIGDFFSGIVSKIVNLFKNIGTKVGNAIGGAFKSVINAILGAIEKILNTPINGINKLINTINEIPGINLGKLDTFKLPRLAKGGIISQPGRGVPLGIGGEGGTSGSREGVLPLTDSQQMELLGEAIGKYININITNITKLDNRQIAREQKVINAQNNFATNR